MTTNSKSVFFGSYGPSSFVVFDATAYKLSTYLAKNPGDTIDQAVAANPNADLILNGALFNYRMQAPMFTTGDVANGGSIISNTAGTPSDAPAVLRYWFGQTNDTSVAKNAGQALSYQFGGQGAPSGVGNGPNNLGSAMGGLISLIVLNGNSPHEQTDTDDSDLRTYNAFRGGPVKAFGVVGVNRANGMLIVLAKAEWQVQSIYDVQDALFKSGTGWTEVVDGSASVAFYVKSSGGVIVRGKRHQAPVSKAETVASYLVFSP